MKMLDMDMMFEKGIFVVRFKGILDKESCKNIDIELTNIIRNNGIKYLLLNLNNVTYIDEEGVRIILDNYKYILENKGKMIICGINKLFEYNACIAENFYQVNDEVAAFNLINI